MSGTPAVSFASVKCGRVTLFSELVFEITTLSIAEGIGIGKSRLIRDWCMISKLRMPISRKSATLTDIGLSVTRLNNNNARYTFRDERSRTMTETSLCAIKRTQKQRIPRRFQ